MLQFDEYKVRLNNLAPVLEELGQALDLESAERELDMLQAESASDGFWNNLEKAQKVQQRIKTLQHKVDSQHKRRVRRGGRRRGDTKARHEFCTDRFAGQEGTDTISTSAAKRISKPLVLAAFFPPFLSPQKEREPPEAAQKFWAPQQDHRPLRMGTCGYEFGDQRRNGYEKVRILWERN